MGVKLAIDRNKRLVVSTYYGEIKDSDVLAQAALIGSHPDFDPSFSEIADFSEVSSGTVSTVAIREMARRPSIYDPASMHVAIAPQPHIFGLARMFQAFADQTRANVAVVRTMNEAHKILGLEKTDSAKTKKR